MIEGGVVADVTEEVVVSGDTAGAWSCRMHGIFFGRWGGQRCSRGGGRDGQWWWQWGRLALRPGYRLRVRRGHPPPDHSKADSQRQSAILWPGRKWLGESGLGCLGIEVQRSHRREEG